MVRPVGDAVLCRTRVLSVKWVALRRVQPEGTLLRSGRSSCVLLHPALTLTTPEYSPFWLLHTRNDPFSVMTLLLRSIPFHLLLLLLLLPPPLLLLLVLVLLLLRSSLRSFCCRLNSIGANRLRLEVLLIPPEPDLGARPIDHRRRRECCQAL